MPSNIEIKARLPDFLELEVVLRPGQTAAEGHAIAADLMRRLGVREADLCSGAYADMVGGAESRPSFCEGSSTS